MKNIKTLVCSIVIVVLFSACRRIDTGNDQKLTHALQLAGDNRSELEDVLKHYSGTEDSLKYKAAVFLIKYMPGKFAAVFPEYDNYKPVFDTLEKLNNDYEKAYQNDHIEFYKLYKRTALNYMMAKHHIKATAGLDFKVKEDIKTITADFLIEDIDYAFKAWQMPWNKNLSFNDFCEYLLPYRYGNEELQFWRKSFYENNIHLLDSFKNEKDPVKVCMYLKGMHDVTRSEMAELGGLTNAIKPLDLIRINTTTSCKDETGVVLLRLRALGVPLSRLTFPYWGNWGSGHDINGLLMLDGKWMPLETGTGTNKFSPPSQFIVSKMFIETYSDHINSGFISNVNSSYVVNPNYIDLTQCITKVTDLTIPFKNLQNGSRTCLCTFNNSDWVPVAASTVQNNRSVFKQVGKGVIYMAGTIASGELTLNGDPFLVDSNGVISQISQSAKYKTITLFRKYPPSDLLNKLLPTLKGCYFQGSNDSLFTNALTLWKIDTLTSLHTVEKTLENAKFQYIRLVFPDISRMSEGLGGIQIYRSVKTEKKLLTGKPISSVRASKTFYNHVFDNNPLTFIKIINQKSVDFKQFYDGENLAVPDKQLFWIGLNFGEKKDITSLEISPRTDDNDVNNTESYELFYWKNDWVSLGQKRATANQIEFNVPENALYLLKNVNKGREIRIFKYENGHQLWY